MPRRPIVLVQILVLALAVMWTPAQAAEPDYMGLDELRSMLAQNPSGISGHFMTIKGGPAVSQQTPVQVAMTVRAIADNEGPGGSSLILFEVTDADVLKTGGIAQGMSGSPLYINQKMIGALSYGATFTLNGLGLATPIEYMLDTQRNFPPTSRTFTLERPVRTDSAGMVRRIRIGTTASERAGTVTMQPAFALQVSGIPKGSAAYRRFEALGGRTGLPLGAGGGQCAAGSGFTSSFDAGTSLGAYYALGSVDLGGYGTVTYRDGDSVLGFGHPMSWVGQTDLFATSAWISGIWGSSEIPYKLGCAGQVQGALTQDRSAAVGVDTATTPATTPVTSTITLDTGTARTATGATSVASGTFQQGLGAEVSAIAVSEPIYRLADQIAMPGTAVTTTTVKVSDGTQSYTITRPNLFSDLDVLGAAAQDTATIVSTLFGTPGIEPTVESVDLTATIDQSTRIAQITGVRGGPLSVGPNEVLVTLKPQGRAAVVVPVQIDIPGGVALEAGLSVDGGAYSIPDEPVESGTQDYDSLAAMVDVLNAAPPNNELVVTMFDSQGQSVRVGKAATDYVLAGSLAPGIPSGSLMADLPEATLGDTVRLETAVSGVPDGAQITFEQRAAGGTAWQPVGVVAYSASSGAGLDVTPDASTSYRASWPGDANTLGWSATTDVALSPPLAVSGVWRGKAWAVTVSSAPELAGSAFRIQARRDSGWKDVTGGTLAADGTASLRWKQGPADVRVRAALAASQRFRAVTSPATTLSALDLIVTPDGQARPAGNVTVQLRTPAGKAVTDVRYRIQRSVRDGWEPVETGRLRKTTRVWLGNGDYRVVVPKQQGVPTDIRTRSTVSVATVLITKQSGGRGVARLTARPAIPLRFTVQQQQAGRWRTVGGWRRLTPPGNRWQRELPTGRYRFVVDQQAGFAGATSEVVRVR